MIIKKLVLFICSTVFIYGKVGVNSSITFYTNDGVSLHNPEMNRDNEYIVIQVTHKVNNQTQLYRHIGIIDFKKANELKPDDIKIFKRKIKSGKSKRIKSYGELLWSKSESYSNEFYYITKAKDGKSEVRMGEVDISNGKMTSFTSSYSRDPNYFGVPVFPESIYQFDVYNKEGYDSPLMVYKKNKKTLIHFDGLNDYVYKYLVGADFNGLTNINKIQLNRPLVDDEKNRDCSIVVSSTNAGQGNYTSNDLLYYPNYEDNNDANTHIYQMKDYKYKNYIFPRDAHHYREEVGSYVPLGAQIEPRFSHDGRWLAYLSQDTMNRKLFHLYTFNVDNLAECRYGIGDEGVIDDIDSRISNSKRIDIDIATSEVWSVGAIHDNNYVWHPKKNILFYIKKDGDYSRIMYVKIQGDSISDPVRLPIPTKENRCLSISQDGRYLLYIYRELIDDDYSFFSNCSNGYSCKRTKEWRLGVSEINVQ